ncbi:hypothetical protein [Marinobacter zhanjiangensis]|uniref:Uncharacterized protein n=1 Tax=Marinobacter zhanjiangensis TaxID=578215 RepID=A0ABQ3B569_9GAMM|nr:hypothetical protein [Marinobacter zhanjiangensis]GGY78706.1 hypothetical protein GCM10007071_27620 [Marinobacter zhanjiangensis]
MLDWISQNNTLVNALTSIGTLFVWVFYAQLLYMGFSRQRRPRMLINKGVGHEYIDSPCLVCNMSQEAVFVFFIVIRLKTSKGVFTAPMTDISSDSPMDDKPGLRERTRQGPLASGQCLQLTSFREMISTILRREGVETDNGYPCDPDIRLEWLEVHVISTYGSDDKAFGAVRRFRVHADTDTHDVQLQPTSLDTTRRKSWRYRRLARRWLREFQ